MYEARIAQAETSQCLLPLAEDRGAEHLLVYKFNELRIRADK